MYLTLKITNFIVNNPNLNNLTNNWCFSMEWDLNFTGFSKPDTTVSEPDFSIENLVSSALGDGSMAQDLKVNDSECELFPNFFEFVTSRDGLLLPNGDGITPYTRQFELSTKLLSEYCPRCTDMDWFNGSDLGTFSTPLKVSPQSFYTHVKLLKHGVCPKCSATKSDMYLNNELPFYNELAAVLGQRSGKSEIVSMLSAYLTHIWLKTQNPTSILGLSPATILYGSFVAVTYNQAYKTLWMKYYNHISKSVWFNKYHKVLDSYAHKTGEELYSLKDTFLAYKHRNLFISPYGPNRKTLRGDTRIFCLAPNTKISTSDGLISIKNNVSGFKTHKGSTNCNIINHKYMGRGSLYRLGLVNGLTLDLTKDHQVLTIDKKHKLVWKQAKDIKNDYVGVSLGGEFPESCHLSFVYKIDEPEYLQVLRSIHKRKSFYLDEVRRDTNAKNMNHQIADLVKDGDLKKKRYGRGGTPYLFWITESFDLNKYIDKRNNKPLISKFNSVVYPKEVTNELAHLLGYLISDGNYILNYFEITYKTTHKNKYDHFVECCVSCFGIMPTVTTPYRLNGDGKLVYGCSYGYRGIKEFFSYVGLTPELSRTKFVPWCINQASKGATISFLSSLIDSDGGHCLNSGFHYNSSSVVLLKGLQLLFMRLGYACKIPIIKEDYLPTPWYGTLYLGRYDSNRFLLDYDGVKVYEKLKISCSPSYKQYRLPYRKRDDGHNILYQYVKPEFDNKYYKCPENTDPNIIWVKSSYFKYLREDDLYDIQVDSEDKTFTANAICTHNCALDELSHFNLDSKGMVKMDADEVHVALENSLFTLRGAVDELLGQGISNIPTGMFMNISSPVSIRDKLMRLYKASLLPDSDILGFQAATWEMNPRLPFKLFKNKLRDNPSNFWRDFGAEPPLSDNPFFPNKEPVLDCFAKVRKNGIVIDKVKIKSKGGTLYTSASVRRIKSISRPTIMTIDAGFNNNSWSTTVAHISPTTQKPIIDLVVEVIPTLSAPLNYSEMYDTLLAPIIESCNVQLLVADRWNSLKILHDAESDFGIDIEQYSMKYKDFLLIKDHILDGNASLPKLEMPSESVFDFDPNDYPACFQKRPLSHLFLQFMTVRDTRNRVDKGDNLTDDNFRSLFLAMRYLLDDYYVNELFNKDGLVNLKNEYALGCSSGISGGRPGASELSNTNNDGLGILGTR